MKSSAASWVEVVRLRTLPASIAPVLLGTGIAFALGAASWPRALLAAGVALALQTGCNLANDYFDGLRGVDDVRCGPPRLTASGAVAPAAVMALASFAVAVAVALGLALLGTLITGLLMYYVLGQPVAAALAALTDWLRGMQTSSAIVLGLLLGGMMAIDMGGPINKAAYTFATGLIASQVYAPMAAGVMGLAFITEGAIPFAAQDPLRVIPALAAGSALTGAIAMSAGCELRVPHGGAFVLPIPNAVSHLGMYLIAIAAGALLSAILLGLLKKKVA